MTNWAKPSIAAPLARQAADRIEEAANSGRLRQRIWQAEGKTCLLGSIDPSVTSVRAKALHKTVPNWMRNWVYHSFEGLAPEKIDQSALIFAKTLKSGAEFYFYEWDIALDYFRISIIEDALASALPATESGGLESNYWKHISNLNYEVIRTKTTNAKKRGLLWAEANSARDGAQMAWRAASATTNASIAEAAQAAEAAALATALTLEIGLVLNKEERLVKAAQKAALAAGHAAASAALSAGQTTTMKIEKARNAAKAATYLRQFESLARVVAQVKIKI